jgi:hypothetical protein
LLDDKYRKLNAGMHFDHYQASAKRTIESLWPNSLRVRDAGRV